MKPYYEDSDSGITIYHGDCREILPGLEFDVVVSDPPYGISHPTAYLTAGRSNLGVCKDYPPVHGDGEDFDPAHLLGFPCVLWGGNHFCSRLPDSPGWLVWDKQRPPTLDQSTIEMAWSNCVKGARIFHHLWNGMMKASERGESYHPTQKPVELMRWCLNQRGVPAGTVLDPYMGSGPVLVAAKDEGRKAIGIEIEERYCEIAANRLAQGVLPFSDSSL